MGYFGALVDKDFKAVYRSFEIDDRDGDVSIVVASSVGYFFGLRQWNISLVKTIVSEEVLYDNQKPLFGKLKNDLKNFYKVRYSAEMYD
ncbi:MAG: hypothetical protein EOO46_00170 [Flavobacterium sp.]|nr:MAG: hypothetical protein EOO46_00170 [Flavobacterium sp.]